MKRKEIESIIMLMRSGYVTNISQQATSLNGQSRCVRIQMDIPMSTDELGELSSALHTVYNKGNKVKLTTKNKSFKIAQRRHEKQVLAKRKHK